MHQKCMTFAKLGVPVITRSERLCFEGTHLAQLFFDTKPAKLFVLVTEFMISLKCL